MFGGPPCVPLNVGGGQVVKERNAMRQDLRRKNMVIEQQRKHAAADMHQFSNFLVSMRAVASQQGGTSSGGSTVV